MKKLSGNLLIKKVGFFLLVFVYLAGGINHFITPETYWPLIPPYLVYIAELNLLSGLAEILLAIGLLIPATRKLSAWGIITMLIAFIPSHLYFIEKGSCISELLCFDPWVAWVRLLLVHPLLMYWAFLYRNYSLK